MHTAKTVPRSRTVFPHVHIAGRTWHWFRGFNFHLHLLFMFLLLFHYILSYFVHLQWTVKLQKQTEKSLNSHPLNWLMRKITEKVTLAHIQAATENTTPQILSALPSVGFHTVIFLRTTRHLCILKKFSVEGLKHKSAKWGALMLQRKQSKVYFHCTL